MTESSWSLLWLSVPGRSGQHDESLGAVLGEQELAVDVDAAEFGMQEGLAVVVALGDLLPFPHADELRAAFLEFGDDPGGSVGVAAGGQRCPQAGRMGAAVVSGWSSSGNTRRSAGSMNQR